MKIFGIEFGSKAEEITTEPTIGSVSTKEATGLHKAYIPEFLYKPPFGYPRKENLPLIRQLARNPYVYSVVKTLCDEAASTKYDIVYKNEADSSDYMDQKRLEILRFLDNPNGNKESFQHIIRAVVRDIAELDSGVIVKAYNRKGQLAEIYARDGASFLKNPDMYGYMGNRKDYVEPMNINYVVTPESPDYSTTLNQYSMLYKEEAAYFQYGFTAAAIPVPFGLKEVIFMMQNPRSDSVYGRSPIEILGDIITTLVFGSNYNLDFYMNNNMPEGIIQLIGANQKQVDAFRERFDSTFRKKDELTGFMRRFAFRYPIFNQEAKFTPFQLDPKLMQIIEQQDWFTKVLWACFGVTADEMGFTADSNKAVSQTQHAISKRKAVRPILQLLKYHFDREIISEWGQDVFDSLEFKWEDYDIEEDIKKHQLLKMQLDMGIKTPEMVANELNIDYEEVRAYNEEQEAKEIDKMKLQSSMMGQQSSFVEEKSLGLKSTDFDNKLEEELVLALKKRAKEINKAFDAYDKGQLNNIQ